MPSTSRGRATGARFTRARLARPGAISSSTHQLPALVHHRRADHRPLRAAPDQRGVAGDPVRPQRGQVADRLDEVRLPDAVGSDEHADARLEIELGALPGPEVGDRETAQVH